MHLLRSFSFRGLTWLLATPLLASGLRCAALKDTKGKSRVKGARPSQNWALPDLVLGGFSWLICCLVTSLSFTLRIPGSCGLPYPCEPVTPETSTSVPNKKMGRRHFLELFRGFLCRALVPPDVAAQAGSSLRRFLPTGGHALRFPDADAHIIGSWVEVAGGGPIAILQHSQPQLMSSLRW